MRARIALLVGLAALAGCKKADDCKSQSAALELDMSLSSDLRMNVSRIQSMVVDMTIGAATFENTYDVTGHLDSGSTSIAVDITPQPMGAFNVTIEARLFDGTGGHGNVVGQATQVYAATPDACNRFQMAINSSTGDGGVPVDAHTADALDLDAGPTDAAPSPDAQPLPDALPNMDAMPNPDATGMDAFVHMDAEPCPLPVSTANDVADYEFEMNLLDSTANHHDGTVTGPGVTYRNGPQGCSMAVSFASANQSYVVVGYSPQFDLANGSIDFEFRPPSPFTTPLANAQAIFSRDGTGVTSGALTVYLSCDGFVIGKLTSGGMTSYICSRFSVMQFGGWRLIGINFGGNPHPFEMFIDGFPMTSTQSLGLGGAGCAQTVTCGGAANNGPFSGNTQPIVFGASIENATTGMSNNPSDFFTGSLDALRVVNVQRNFFGN
jgi:hypothetical protein